MANNKQKYPFGVGIYDLESNLIKRFNQNVQLARYLAISKTTVGKYIKTGKMFNGLYYIKINQE